MVKRRADNLKVDYLSHGKRNKLEIVNELCSANGISLEQVAYLGDDLNDMQVLEAVGLSACPSSAPKYVQKIVDKVLIKKGGEGAFREFVEEHVLAERLEELVAQVAGKKQNQ